MVCRRFVVSASLVLAAVVAFAGPAPAAAPKQFIALLNASQETPPTGEVSTGIAHLTFNDASKMLCVSLTYADLSSAETMAHVHGALPPLAPSIPGAAGGILYNLPLGNPKTACVGPLTNQEKGIL